MEAPGFLSDAGKDKDLSWFIVGLLGEAFGLAATIGGGLKNGGSYLSASIFAAVMFVFLDYFCAAQLHRHEGLRCRLRSRLLTANVAGERKDIEVQLGKGKFIDYLLKVGIILIALLKIAAIFLLGVFDSGILYVPFAVIYLIVAYVHWNHTGYFFSYFVAERAIAKDYKKLGPNHFEAQPRRRPFEVKSELTNVPVRHVPHEIVATGRPLEYEIQTKGILTDEDIGFLINGQTPENRIAIFHACRDLQTQMVLG